MATMEELLRNPYEEGGGASPRARSALTIGVAQDPDRVAEADRLARDTNLPPQMVYEDPTQAKINKRLKDIDTFLRDNSSPITQQWLASGRRAALSHDDVEVLSAIERSAATQRSRRGYFDNAARGIANTFSRIGTSTASALAWGAEEASKVFTRPNDVLLSWAYQAAGKEYPGGAEQILQGAEEDVRQFAAGVEKQSEQVYDYENRADIDAVIENPTPATVASFIAEAGPAAVPYLIASGVSPWLVYPGIADMIAKDRVANDNRTGLPTDKDMAVALPFAAASGLIERYTAGKIFKGGRSPTGGFAGYAAAEIPRAGAREFTGEFFQGGIEAVGGMVGTEAGLDMGEVGKQALAEGLAGFGVGTGMRAITVGPDYRSQVARSAMESAVQRMASQSEQNYLDDMISYAQESLVNPRSPEDFEDFIQSVDPDTQVFIDPAPLGELEGLPEQIAEQIDGTGAEVQLSMRDLLRHFARDETWLPFVRPHLRVGEHGKTLRELENEEPDPHVQTMINKAMEREEAWSEADAIYEQVKDQIVGTQRQGEATARHSAEVVKAWFVTAQERLQKKGVEVSIQELFEKSGFSVVGPSGKAEGAPEFLNQVVEEKLQTQEGMREAIDRIGRENFERLVDTRLDQYDRNTLDPETVASEVDAVAQGALAGEYDAPLTQSQDFGDLQFDDEYDNGSNIERITQPAQEAWDDAQARLEAVERLKECING